MNCPEKGFSIARNTAVKVAKNEIIVFTDSDCIVPKNWLNELLKGFEFEGVEAVGGPTEPPKTNLLGYCISALGYPAGGIKRTFEKAGFTKELSTCNFAMKKHLQKKVLFDDSFIYGGEDTDLMKRIVKSSKMYFNPHAVIEHKPRESLTSFVKWWLRRGKADFVMHKKYLPAFPRSLVSPKVSRLQHTILVLLITALLSAFDLFYFYLFIASISAFVFIRIWAKQKNYAQIKQALPISNIWYWTLIPFLNYIKDIIRDIGRLQILIPYLISKE